MSFGYVSLIELHTIFISHIYCNISGTVPLMLPFCTSEFLGEF